ncbi:MAG: hypothetical protein GY765_37205, partial [bacterium]|nr:hypothetical protein [bacterium]
MTDKKTGQDHVSLKGILEPADILLVASPCVSPTTPMLGLHLLQASCREAGIDTRVFYPNAHYSQLLGGKLHTSIYEGSQLLMADRLFAFALFGNPDVSIGKHMHKFSDPCWTPDHLWTGKKEKDTRVPPFITAYTEWLGDIDAVEIEALTNRWLDDLVREIVDTGYSIVGCSNTFGGLLPPIALLDRIKKAAPRVTTILGGAMCDLKTAEGILTLNAGVDYIFSGEGEITFPIVARRILDGDLPKEAIIHGRDIVDINSTPVPDYDDYIQQKDRFAGGREFHYALPFETSRDCQYG